MSRRVLGGAWLNGTREPPSWGIAAGVTPKGPQVTSFGACVVSLAWAGGAVSPPTPAPPVALQYGPARSGQGLLWQHSGGLSVVKRGRLCVSTPLAVGTRAHTHAHTG